MVIPISNFGDILMSRPAGREAFLMAKAYVFNEIKENDDIILDFDRIKVLAPSWADEFITGMKNPVASHEVLRWRGNLLYRRGPYPVRFKPSCKVLELIPLQAAGY